MCKHASHAVTCYACTIDDLAEIYMDAKRAYYAGEPVMSDSVFDWLEERIRGLDPEHDCLQQVGTDRR